MLLVNWAPGPRGAYGGLLHARCSVHPFLNIRRFFLHLFKPSHRYQSQHDKVEENKEANSSRDPSRLQYEQSQPPPAMLIA